MNTYFEIEKGKKRFDSRERAMEQLAKWKADAQALTLSVHEVQNTEVTRKTAKGHIITETARGSLEGVPRIISVGKVYPTYVVVQGQAEPSDLCRGYHRHFESRAEADKERTSMMLEAERLASLTDADINEVHVPTLADILERDADKIAGLEAEVTKTSVELEELKKQAKASIASEVANITSKIDALQPKAHFTSKIAALKAKAHALYAKAAQDCGLPQAEEKFDAAVQAYKKAIYYDVLEEQARERLQENHNCWPDSPCRECRYEPDIDEIEEYLLENAEEFEIEPDEPTEKCSSQAA